MEWNPLSQLKRVGMRVQYELSLCPFDDEFVGEMRRQRRRITAPVSKNDDRLMMITIAGREERFLILSVSSSFRSFIPFLCPLLLKGLSLSGQPFLAV